MCSRLGDLSLVIPIFWMQESHKGGSTWESWILIGDWEIIGDRSSGQVQCIFMFNFRGHMRVGRVATVPFFWGGGGGWIAACIASYPQYWPLFLAALHLWARSCITIEQQVTFSYVCENILWVQWTRVAFLIHCQLGTSCINRHFCILDVAEIESFICCLFSCVMGGHDATWLLIAINAPLHSWFVYVDFVVVLN